MARKTKDLAEAYPAACAEAKCKAVAPFVGALARAAEVARLGAVDVGQVDRVEARARRLALLERLHDQLVLDLVGDLHGVSVGHQRRR